MARVRNFRSVEQKINSQLLLLLLLLLQHSYSAQIQASSSPLIYEFLTSQKLVWVGHIAQCVCDMGLTKVQGLSKQISPYTGKYLPVSLK